MTNLQGLEAQQANKTIVGSSGPEAPRPGATRPTQQITQRLNDTRLKTKDITQKVKASFPNLTPHENIYNVPNFLTVTRLVAAPAVGYLIVRGDLKWALGLFFYAGVTDLIDGWMARKYNLQTVVGSVIDPMADKLLMTVMTITLAAKGLMPAYLATLILGRDVTLAVAAIYYRYASLPAPKTFARYWDFSLPSAQVHPTTVSKYNTFLQLLLIGALLAIPVITAEPWLIQGLENVGGTTTSIDQGTTYFQYLVAATTAWSGLSYAVLKDAVTILGTDEALKQKQGKIGRAIIGIGFGTLVLASAWLALFRDARPDDKRDGDKDKRVSIGKS
ncbi:CDP-alcohol phosphatidyltransferase-like protein [Elsinoe fawcettii]|nr:CDP-alcohol phosphatidyltransferase-like protein [Elsinoe fawcettii]